MICFTRRFASLSLLVAVLLLLPACETTFEVEPPETEPQLVINGLFEVDSLWAIDVSRLAQTRQEYDRREVENATVEVLQEGQVLGTLRAEPSATGVCGETGHYCADDLRPAPGQAYTLRVSAPGFDPVEATGRAPVAVPFNVDSEVRTSSERDRPEIRATLRFHDPSGAANYYRVFVFQRNVYEDDDGTRQFFFRGRAFESRDPVILDGAYDRVILEAGEPLRFFSAAFSDEVFDGREYALSLTVPSYAYDPGPQTEGYYAVLASISADYYRYLKSRQPLVNSYDENPFEEPVELYSNVEGGLGIFAGSNGTVQRIDD